MSRPKNAYNDIRAACASLGLPQPDSVGTCEESSDGITCGAIWSGLSAAGTSDDDVRALMKATGWTVRW